MRFWDLGENKNSGSITIFLTLEIPENGTTNRVPKSTVEYQIGHDQKIIFLPLEPQKVW